MIAILCLFFETYSGLASLIHLLNFLLVRKGIELLHYILLCKTWLVDWFATPLSMGLATIKSTPT